MRVTWARPSDLLVHEFVQARSEGFDPSSQEARWQAAGHGLTPPVSGCGDEPETEEDRRLALDLLDELDLARERRGGEGDTSTSGERSPAASPTLLRLDDLDDRVLGAWRGRAVGCLLGKPVEKIPREGIREILESTTGWPLTGYFTARGLRAEVAERWPWNRRSAPTSLAENISGMPEDDDMNFPVLALELLETHGADFSVDDVAGLWLSALPAGRVFTAERAAYRNLLNGIPPVHAARHHNPFREWIGALIRADVMGWSVPGDPMEAARRAAVDASLTHVGAGVHGAMWAAALCSTAVVAGSVDEVLDAGEAAIPADGDLGRAVASGRRIARETPDLDDALDALHAEWGHLHWVHVLNNAATIAWALAAAAEPSDSESPIDFTGAVTRAVMAGWDTDSAGATVGSIAGALLGANRMDPSWTAPLDDTYRTSLPGLDRVTFTELADRTVALITGTPLTSEA